MTYSPFKLLRESLALLGLIATVCLWVEVAAGVVGK